MVVTKWLSFRPRGFAVSDPILAVGDFFTYGDEASDWETWPAQLEKLTGRKVINGGVFGYGIDQAFLRARRLLSRYRFSTVIFGFIPDDIKRCQMSERYWNKPYFDFRDGRLTLENVQYRRRLNPRRRASCSLQWSIVGLRMLS